jgi:hypothetical protein
MNVHFQSLLRLGIGLDFPASLIYVSVIYIAAIAMILWAGLGIYLTIVGGFRLRGFLCGRLVILLVVVPSLTAGIFLKGLQLPPSVVYMTIWLPLFLALWLSICVGLRAASGMLVLALKQWNSCATVRRERRWTSAGLTPARELVRSTRQRRRTSGFDLLQRGAFS